MKQLILNPTDTSQWHALVNEAQVSTHFMLNEDTESYLVFLLMRFSQTTRLLESVIGLDFLNATHVSGRRQIELLREVGDKSLLLCGLFPGMAEKHHVSLEYFSEMGQGAYLTVSEMHERAAGQLYVHLSEQFIGMQHVLEAMRGENVQCTHDDKIHRH